MKLSKLNALTAALLLGMGVSSMAQAVFLQVGNFAMKLNDITYFDDPTLSGSQPPPPGWTGSGRAWGIGNVTSIHQLISSPEGNVINPIPYWSASAGDLLQFRYGGSYNSYNCSVATGCVATSVAQGFPYDAYFEDATAPYTKLGKSYVEIYSRTSDGFLADYTAGPGTGLFGAFGTAIAGAGGTLWLDLVMNPGALSFYDPLTTAAVVEKTTVTGLTTAAATIYADIVGGTAQSQFGTDIFPVAAPLYPIRSDIKMVSNLTALFDPVSGLWTDPNGWTQSSQDPVTGGVVPEPATLALLGLGLLGLAGLRRKAA